jgi:carbonic anhydrase
MCRRAASPALAVFLWTIACTPAPDARPAGATTEAKMPAPGTPHWSYEGAEGPAQWGALGAAFAACSSGQSQSPIDIAVTRASALPMLRAAHQPVGLHVSHHEHIADGINTGHTIQVNYDGADTLELGDDRYALAQYHFHAPSEHTVQGSRFPMEMHFVHKAADGRLAVIAVPMVEGKSNPALVPVWSNLPSAKGSEVKVPHVTVDVDELLPTTLTTYRYDGSLTTPPCSEGVKWLVMTTPIEVGPEQIAAFRAVVRDNNRPIQPLNGRAVETDQVVEAP